MTQADAEQLLNYTHATGFTTSHPPLALTISLKKEILHVINH